jgi:hypothetical protein
MVMKRFSCFGIILLTSFLLASCSKDILKTYDQRIIGDWEITEINGFGFGGYSLTFSEDEKFSFSKNGQLTHTSGGQVYQGSWDIRKIVKDDNTTQALHITAVNFGSQAVRTEYFNDLQFTTSNRFKAVINNGTKAYIYHFVRD